MPPPYPQLHGPYGYDGHRHTNSHGLSPTPYPRYHVGGQWSSLNPHAQYQTIPRPPREHGHRPRHNDSRNPNPHTQLPPWMPPNTPPLHFLGPSRRGAHPFYRPPQHRRLRNPPSPVPLASLASDELECHICFEEFGTANPDTGESEGPIRLQCGHIFGADCFNVWLQAGLQDLGPTRFGAAAQPWRRCPVCQGELDVVEE